MFFLYDCLNWYIGLATKWFQILSTYIVFLLFELPPLNKKNVSISYLVSFLSQFKNGRTTRQVFQTYILLYCFWKGKNALQAHKKLCAIYGNEDLKERQCQNWFDKFCSSNFSLKRSGHPIEVHETYIKTIIDWFKSSAQHMRLQRSSMHRRHGLKKKIQSARLDQET